MIMDLCTGGNLLDFMKKRPPSHPAAEALARDFLRQMLYAVKYLHEHQIVHRDLKLENWLLQSPPVEQGGSGSGSGSLPPRATLKLIDFGLSKFFAKNEMMVQSVGSLYYVAPYVIFPAVHDSFYVWPPGMPPTNLTHPCTTIM